MHTVVSAGRFSFITLIILVTRYSFNGGYPNEDRHKFSSHVRYVSQTLLLRALARSHTKIPSTVRVLLGLPT
jgi:hypothetical protein